MTYQSFDELIAAMTPEVCDNMRRAIETGNGYGPVGMLTRDLDADLARAVKAGAKQKGETVSFGPARIAFVLTPDGHEIEMMQIAAKAAA